MLKLTDGNLQFNKMSKVLQLSIIVGVLIISFSVFYYFVIFLPQKEQVRVNIQEQQQAIKQSADCRAVGEKLYKEDKQKWDLPGVSVPTSSPIYYYNKKLNTCIYVVTISYVKPENAPNLPYIITVKDSLANQVLIEYTQNAYEDVTNSTVKKRRAKFDQKYDTLLSE